MLRFSSGFQSLSSTLISSGAWVTLSERTFLQTQAWSSCFEVFHRGSSIHWAEWEQGNARLLLVMPVTSSPSSLWKQPWPWCISQQQFSAGEGRVEGAHSRTSLQAQQGSCSDPTNSAFTQTLCRNHSQIWPMAKGSSSLFCFQPHKGWAQLFKNITVFACFPKVHPSNVSQSHGSSSFI